MSTQRDLELLYEVGCYRFLQRSWRQFLNPDFQNASEHTLRVIWLALILAKYESVTNTDKVLKMALVHDLSESRSGDLHYVSRQYSDRNEDKSIEDILRDTALDGEMVELWKEYEKHECIEAQVVKDADYLDVDLELQEQEARGHKLKDHWKGMRKKVRDNLYTKSAQHIWDAIQTSNPHDWHSNARNRFNDGDWKNK